MTYSILAECRYLRWEALSLHLHPDIPPLAPSHWLPRTAEDGVTLHFWAMLQQSVSVPETWFATLWPNQYTGVVGARVYALSYRFEGALGLAQQLVREELTQRWRGEELPDGIRTTRFRGFAMVQDYCVPPCDKIEDIPALHREAGEIEACDSPEARALRDWAASGAADDTARLAFADWCFETGRETYGRCLRETATNHVWSPPECEIIRIYRTSVSEPRAR